MKYILQSGMTPLQELLAAVTNWTCHRATEQEETGSSALHTDFKELSDKPSNILHTKLHKKSREDRQEQFSEQGMATGRAP